MGTIQTWWFSMVSRGIYTASMRSPGANRLSAIPHLWCLFSWDFIISGRLQFPKFRGKPWSPQVDLKIALPSFVSSAPCLENPTFTDCPSERKLHLCKGFSTFDDTGVVSGFVGGSSDISWLVVKKPSWNIWVRQWEGLSIHIMENKIHVPNHQPVRILINLKMAISIWPESPVTIIWPASPSQSDESFGIPGEMEDDNLNGWNQPDANMIPGWWLSPTLVVNTLLIMINIWLYYMVDDGQYWYLVGGIPTPLKNDGVRQLGWWHSQLNGKIKHVPNHPTRIRVVENSSPEG